MITVRLLTSPFLGLIVTVNIPRARTFSVKVSGIILLIATLFLLLAFFCVVNVHAQEPTLNSVASKVDVLASRHDDLAARVVTLESLPVRTAQLESKVDEILGWAKWIVAALALVVVERAASVLGLSVKRDANPVKP